MDWIVWAISDSQTDIWLGICGGVLLVLGLTSGLINNRWSISEPLVALAAGTLVGPVGLNWAQLDGEEQTTQFLHLAARLTLAVALVDAAISLPTSTVFKAWRPIAVMLMVVMPCMWLLTSTLAYFTLGVGLMTALLMGAALTPTDPVLASAIVQSRIAEQRIPDRLRWLVTAESGANDALALPMVLLPIMLTRPELQQPWLHWLFWGVFWELAVSIAIGVVAGWVSARMLRWAASSPDADRTSLLTVVLALALALLGTIHLIDSDGLLAVFVSGLVLNHFIRDESESRHERLHEAIRRFFELPVFVILGAALPWSAWQQLGWSALAFPILVLLLRRLPVVVLASRLVSLLQSWREALFVGWFGPIGIAALFYATLAHREYQQRDIWPTVSLVVVASIVAHGVTATALTKRFRVLKGS